MRIIFLIDNMKFSGGRKLFFEYANFLKSKNHNVLVLSLSEKGELNNLVSFELKNNFSPFNIPESDLIITTTPKETEAATKSKKGKVIHFCQGFEIEDLENRIYNNILPLRYQKYLHKGIWGQIKLLHQKRYWKKKACYFDKIYRLNTTLVTVSQHLKDELEKRYKKKVYLCKNGIHCEFFYPNPKWTYSSFTHENPCKIINIGPIKVTFKGIQDTLKAIKMAKENNLPIKFIRVEPQGASPTEVEKELCDEFYTALPPEKLADLLRSSDVYISNSHEGEGFGLPAMEALGCGCVSVLNSISSYHNFSNRENFCLFVKENATKETYYAIQKIINYSEKKFTDLRKNGIDVAKKNTFASACAKFEKILYQINKPI